MQRDYEVELNPSQAVAIWVIHILTNYQLLRPNSFGAIPISLFHISVSYICKQLSFIVNSLAVVSSAAFDG